MKPSQGRHAQAAADLVVADQTEIEEEIAGFKIYWHFISGGEASQIRGPLLPR